MYIDIRMSSKKQKIEFEGPILPGSVSTAQSQCGKPNCACKQKPPKLHGTYYRWTGTIEGKRTTKTITREIAVECERRIKNYRRLRTKLDRIIKEAIRSAPWNEA
jgi:hypothetical protein